MGGGIDSLESILGLLKSFKSGTVMLNDVHFRDTERATDLEKKIARTPRHGLYPPINE
jgi:hypothetical protein